MPVSKRGSTSWTGTAFMVETLVLLFFLIASLAVFTQLFAYSANEAKQANRITEATAIAQNAAEEFSVNPQAVAAGRPVGLGAAQGAEGYTVTCTVKDAPQATGTYYAAHISVSDDEGEAYALDAARYVEGAN